MNLGFFGDLTKASKAQIIISSLKNAQLLIEQNPSIS
jgi:hypothetical protein